MTARRSRKRWNRPNERMRPDRPHGPRPAILAHRRTSNCRRARPNASHAERELWRMIAQGRHARSTAKTPGPRPSPACRPPTPWTTTLCWPQSTATRSMPAGRSTTTSPSDGTAPATMSSDQSGISANPIATIERQIDRRPAALDETASRSARDGRLGSFGTGETHPRPPASPSGFGRACVQSHGPPRSCIQFRRCSLPACPSRGHPPSAEDGTAT